MNPLDDFLAGANQDPQQAMDQVLSNLCRVLEANGASANSIHGVRIAMQMAFHLGERHGINITLKAQAEENEP
jgi:hypothetical protein